MAIIFIKSLSTQSSLTRRFFSSVRALGVALIVIATLLSTVDAYALTRSKSTKYGTLRYTIHNLDGKYKPGEHYSLVATFAANDKVYGSQSSFMIVKAGSRTLCRQKVVVKKNSKTSASASFTAPSDGSPLKISFGNDGNDVFESITVTAMKEEVVKQEEKEVPSSTIDENSNNDTGNSGDNNSENASYDDDNPSNDGESTDDGEGASDAEEKNSTDDISSQDEGFLAGLADNDVIKAIQDFWANDPLGLDREATPEEAVSIGAVAAILSLLAGGVGAIGGGIGGIAGGIGGGAGAMGGGIPSDLPPNLPEEYAFVDDYDWDKENEEGGDEGEDAEEIYDDPPQEPEEEQDPADDINSLIDQKYVQHNPDGSITVTDPVVGSKNTYEPDGNGGWDNPLTGAGFNSDSELLSHLASRDENHDVLLKDAQQAIKNLEDHRKEWEEKVKQEYDQKASKESDEYHKWKVEQEQKLEDEIRMEHRIEELSSKFHVEPTKDAVMKALAEQQSKDMLESYEQQAYAEEYGKSEQYSKTVKTTAAVGMVAVPLVAATGGAVLGTGALTAAEIGKAKLVYDVYTVSKSVTEFNGEALLHNGGLKDHASATLLGLVHGGFGVVQNHVGVIASNNTIVNNTVGKFIFNTSVEGGLYVGSEVSKGALYKGYSEYEKTGDFYKAQEAALNSIPDSAKSGAKSFLIQKSLEGVVKTGSALKEKISPSGTPSQLQSKINSAKTDLKYKQARVEGAKTHLNDTRNMAAKLKDEAAKKADIAKTAAEKSDLQAKETAKTLNKYNAAKEKINVAKESLKAAKTDEARAAAQKHLDNMEKQAKVIEQEAHNAQKQAEIARNEAEKAAKVATEARAASKVADSSVKEAQHNVSKASADERIAQGKVTAAENKAKMYNDQREERVDYVAGLAGSTVDNAEQNLNNNDNNSK